MLLLHIAGLVRPNGCASFHQSLTRSFWQDAARLTACITAAAAARVSSIEGVVLPEMQLAMLWLLLSLGSIVDKLVKGGPDIPEVFDDASQTRFAP